MPRYYMQAVIVREFVVDADDELQAERVVFSEAGNDRHNIVGMKCYGESDEYIGEGALSGDHTANMEEVRTFSAVDTDWCDVS